MKPHDTHATDHQMSDAMGAHTHCRTSTRAAISCVDNNVLGNLDWHSQLVVQGRP
jgi:hypothetical protein